MPKAKSSSVSVSILGQDYQVSCLPDEVDAVKKSADYLDGKMREMKGKSSVISRDRLAVMAALNIANDMLAQAEQADRLGALAGKVDSALGRLKEK